MPPKGGGGNNNKVEADQVRDPWILTIQINMLMSFTTWKGVISALGCGGTPSKVLHERETSTMLC
jgi:hypothetical protein